MPPGVTRTRDDPPHGGPVAGIAAGLRALGEAAPLVLVLACDLPGAAAAVPRLLEVACHPPAGRDPALGGSGTAPGGSGGGMDVTGGRDVAGGDGRVWRDVAGGDGRPGRAGTDGVALRDADGRAQWLLGASVRELVEPLCLAPLLALPGEAHDVDTCADRDAVTP